jgi:hypothetical protein
MGSCYRASGQKVKEVREVAIIAQGRRDSRMRLSFNLRNNDSFGDVEFEDVLQ